MLSEEKSGPNSPLKGNRRGSVNNSNNHNKATPLSNGDVEMESAEDSDDDGPLEPLPLPKVSHFYLFRVRLEKNRESVRC